MLTDSTVDEIIMLCNNRKETTLKEMKNTLEHFGIQLTSDRKQISDKTTLPKVALLSLETPKCWHWSLFFDGTFFDPEYGVLNDFPPSYRRYYWEITETSKE